MTSPFGPAPDLAVEALFEALDAPARRSRSKDVVPVAPASVNRPAVSPTIAGLDRSTARAVEFEAAVKAYRSFLDARNQRLQVDLADWNLSYRDHRADELMSAASEAIDRGSSRWEIIRRIQRYEDYMAVTNRIFGIIR